MPITAINTVAIHGIPGQAAPLHARLQQLLEVLLRHSGCATYGLIRSHEDDNTWIMTGYWYSAASLIEHLNMPCLGALFELTADRLATGLRFATYRIADSASS
ncbi:antibiotic biosynthesis monooxygenase family protein [Pseudomonas sp. Pseusp122]|uniref:antibiotic biosynthesis monooxygenase family protein n=1 Tax=unclassified Pseudomonas TaxID=196821 RepID=UPI0039A61DC4